MTTTTFRQAAPPFGNRIRWVRAATWVAAVTVAGLAALLIVAQTRPNVSQPSSARYLTETVTRGGVTGVLVTRGALQAFQTARVGVTAIGTVTNVAVAPGQTVRRGQVLARLDATDARAHWDGAVAGSVAAQAKVREAELHLARIFELLDQVQGMPDLSSDEGPSEVQVQEVVTSAETQYVQALAELKLRRSQARAARAQVQRTVLRAPFDGVVVEQAARTGEVVTPGHAPLFVVAADLGRLVLITSVGERDAAHIRQGARASFMVPAHPQRRFEAVVRAIGEVPLAEAPADAPAYRVELEVDNGGRELRPGMTATITLPASSVDGALRVPLDALRFSPELPTGGKVEPAVWVAGQDGRPARVPIELGITDGKLIEIRDTPMREGQPVLVGVTSP